MKSHSPQRVVITGLGIITAIGDNLPDFRRALFDGRSGIGPVTLFEVSEFPCTLAGQVGCTDLSAGFSAKTLKRVSRCDLLGLIAAREAVADAGLTGRTAGWDRGVVMGGGSGGMLSWEIFRRARAEGRRAPASGLICSPPCTLTDRLAGQYGLGGYRATVTTACSSSTTAIGVACDMIRSGALTLALTGGSEALCELTFAGFNALRVMSPEPCRPFDKDRRGLSLGEGAAVLVLESQEHAIQRGAPVYAEVLGHAINSDAYHMTAPHPEGLGMRTVMTRALENAGLAASQVAYVNAHGTATRVNDPLETRAVKTVFGPERRRMPLVSSTKSMVGHCLGAAGGIEAVATVLAVHHQTAPPTAGLSTPDPECDLDYVAGKARPTDIGYAISNSFAFGGNNTCIVFKRADG
ncbi:MAG: beta-ketoacyl-[acyl-carrier-protein] synthase family protein [Desulfosarcinaceae bacterium]